MVTPDIANGLNKLQKIFKWSTTMPPTHTHTENKSQQAAARRITTEPKSKNTKTQDANAGVQVRQDPI